MLRSLIGSVVVLPSTPITVGLVGIKLALFLFTPQTEGDEMQITLNQAEIESVIISYISDQGISITGKSVSVSLTAGRGVNGMTASINITDTKPESTCEDTVTNEPDTDIPNSSPSENVSEDEALFGN
jgi:hypothetical protein